MQVFKFKGDGVELFTFLGRGAVGLVGGGWCRDLWKRGGSKGHKMIFFKFSL